jgi:hypothetical protein
MLSVDIPLDGVPAVIEEEDDGFETLTHHH